MPVDKATTYHPYAACLMFKACHSSDVVQANLDAVVAHGMSEEFERVRDGIANAVEDWPHNDYYPPTIAEMIREIGPTPTAPNVIAKLDPTA